MINKDNIIKAIENNDIKSLKKEINLQGLLFLPSRLKRLSLDKHLDFFAECLEISLLKCANKCTDYLLDFAFYEKNRDFFIKYLVRGKRLDILEKDYKSFSIANKISMLSYAVLYDNQDIIDLFFAKEENNKEKIKEITKNYRLPEFQKKSLILMRTQPELFKLLINKKQYDLLFKILKSELPANISLIDNLLSKDINEESACNIINDKRFEEYFDSIDKIKEISNIFSSNEINEKVLECFFNTFEHHVVKELEKHFKGKISITETRSKYSTQYFFTFSIDKKYQDKDSQDNNHWPIGLSIRLENKNRIKILFKPILKLIDTPDLFLYSLQNHKIYLADILYDFLPSDLADKIIISQLKKDKELIHQLDYASESEISYKIKKLNILSNINIDKKDEKSKKIKL